MYAQFDVRYPSELAPRPMSLVVGGVVPREDVVGRVRESTEILASCRARGAVLVGDRRHGKTSLSRLVHGWPPSRAPIVVSVSAERETYAEFVSALISELARLDPTWATGTREDPAHPEGRTRCASNATRAAATLDELLHHAIRRARGHTLALFIDEVSVLARNLERAKARRR